jgi:hypothetical protein
MSAPDRANDPKRKPVIPDPWDGGEDPFYSWTSETQDEMARHYESLEKKDKEGK